MSAEVRVLHWMMRNYELPGAGGEAADDLSMGLLLDISAAQMPVIEVDNTHFSHVGGAGVRVPTVAVMPDRREEGSRRTPTVQPFLLVSSRW